MSYNKFENILFNENPCSKIIFFLWLLAVYPPYCLFGIFPQTLKVVFRLLILASIYICYFLYVLKYKKIDLFLIIMTIFSLFQVFSTFINREYLKAAVYQNTIITIAGLITLDLLSKNGIRYMIKVLLHYFTIVIVFNLVFTWPLSQFFYIDGWLIGRRTSFILVFIPAFFLKVLYDHEHKSKFLNKSTILLCFLMMLTTILDFSSTLFALEIISFVGAYYIYNYNKIRIDFKLYITIYLLVFFIFVLPGTKNPFSQYFAIVLGKSPTASGRLPIYDSYIALFKNRPLIQNIIGGGFLKPEVYRDITHSAVFAHNIILQVFCDFGIIGVMFFVFQIIYTSISTYALKESVKQLVQLFFFVMLFRSSYDSYQYYDWVFILGLVINISSKYIINLQNIKIERHIVQYRA